MKQTILIIDDTPEFLKILINILGDTYRTLVAKNGQQGLESAIKEIPDLILLDIVMPDMDGYEVCKQLKANTITKNIPVIFLTIKREANNEALGFDVGAVDYIGKPFWPELVKARVKTQLELKQHRDQLEQLVQARTYELEQAQKQVETAYQIKNQFLANMGHELRTPMNGVTMIADILLDDLQVNGEIREYITMMLTSAHAQLTIIDDILTFSTLEAGQVTLHKQPFEPQHIIQMLSKFFQIEIYKKSLTWVTKIDNDVPKTLIGDASRIRQILINIVGNAIKFTEIGKISIHVSIEQPLTLRFTITDTGIGIIKQKQASLFTPFYQADGSTTRLHGGVGVGLANAKYLLEIMGGEIGLTSDEGKGSRFWFTLPYQVSEQSNKE